MNTIECCPTEPVRRYGTSLGPVPTATTQGYYVPRQRDFVDAFYDAYSALRAETEHSSLMQDTLASPHFQRIVDLGEKAIPLIIHELYKEPSMIFLALHEITGENPIPQSARGKPREIVEAWLLWAERASVNAD